VQPDQLTEKESVLAESRTGSESDAEEVLKTETVAKKYNLPEGFVYVDEVIPTVELEIRYYTEYNFVGEKINGYVAPLAILTTQAANSLKAAADKLAADGYRIRVYDAYRPQKAVDHFVRWAQNGDASTKEIFYPSMEKSILFSDGYISKKSRHSRGSTVDLTIVDKDDNEIDMGGYFDLLDTVSNYNTDKITENQHANREYLRNIMDEAGFDSIRTEWWHFQMREEPYPDTYFDFDIE
jgi:D-alanyl-D-alanine dipeptidase